MKKYLITAALVAFASPAFAQAVKLVNPITSTEYVTAHVCVLMGLKGTDLTKCQEAQAAGTSADDLQATPASIGGGSYRPGGSANPLVNPMTGMPYNSATTRPGMPASGTGYVPPTFDSGSTPVGTGYIPPTSPTTSNPIGTGYTPPTID